MLKLIILEIPLYFAFVITIKPKESSAEIPVHAYQEVKDKFLKL